MLIANFDVYSGAPACSITGLPRAVDARSPRKIEDEFGLVRAGRSLRTQDFTLIAHQQQLVICLRREADL